MPKERTQAQIDAERRQKQKVKRVQIQFRTDNPEDMQIYEWLQSQVDKSADIPGYIKELLKNKITENNS